MDGTFDDRLQAVGVVEFHRRFGPNEVGTGRRAQGTVNDPSGQPVGQGPLGGDQVRGRLETQPQLVDDVVEQLPCRVLLTTAQAGQESK
ncbi:hypothetical protein [Streptomyces sp. NPDC059142]|uniref:hypothetical protein n=1 Tax=Streptomyces sp. NPDC059142 TaxID=3346739 RepID=UPI003693625F